MAEVELISVTKKFGNHTVVDHFSISIKNGEFVTLLGPSGCGKTTLLRMIAGLEGVDSGDIFIGGKRCNFLPAQKRNVAMVFQSYALFPHMTVRKNILFGLKLKKVELPVQQQKFAWVTNLLGLGGLEDRFPREISGGQRQRVALARALVLDPEVLLLDEPLSNLDAALRETAIEELKNIHHTVGTTILYVTHNQIEAMTMSERIALINNGSIEQYASPKRIYDYPSTVFTASFLGSPPMNFFTGKVCTSEERTGIDTAIGFLQLDKERSLRLAAMQNREVLVGVRPQSIYFTEHVAQRRFTDATVGLCIELIENMGDRSLIIGNTGSGVKVRFMVTREEVLSTGQNVSVCIDGRSIHLFDPLQQLNIFNPDGTI